MSPGGLNERESSQKFGALSYVHTIHEQYVKLHEHHYLTYIQMIDLHISQNRIQSTYSVLEHRHIHYDINTQFVMW